MKKIEIYEVITQKNDGDSFSSYHFDKKGALIQAQAELDHLTPSEKAKNVISVVGYSIDVPDDYAVTTSERLMCDLFSGDVNSPQLDQCFGFKAGCVVYSDVIE